MSIQELLELGVKKLRKNKIEEPIFIARLLLSFVLKKDKIYLITNSDKNIGEIETGKFFECLDKYINNIPLQYITNSQEFMKLDFFVNENILIPRADTEIVVGEAIQIINDNKFSSALDLCTGSGAIAVSIAKYTKNCNIVASDVSKKALDIALKNAVSNDVSNKINFVCSNMFESIQNKFDLIISNPPYIKRNVILGLDENVKKEPWLALDGGEDGLDFYKIIAENAYKFLNENGYLVLEIGFDQKEDVENLLKDNYKDIICKKDLGGNNRAIICKRR